MRVTDIIIKRTSSYGRYEINGVVNGVDLIAFTTDSEAFDYLNDEDFPDKQESARRECTYRLSKAYNQD